MPHKKGPGSHRTLSFIREQPRPSARGQIPVASETHFFMWLVLAAPASFFAVESAAQAVLASFSHFVMKLLSAAPASFLLSASPLHVANALVVINDSDTARTMVFMLSSGDRWRALRHTCDAPI